MKPEENLKKFSIKLPNAPDPVGGYVASKIVGDFIYVSGQVSFNTSGKLIKGKVGKELSLEQGQEAAKFCALNILAQLKKKCGSLDKVKGCIKLTGYVNSTNSFEDQPKIINGASDLLVSIFGDKGRHARFAVGSNALPMNISIAKVKMKSTQLVSWTIK